MKLYSVYVNAWKNSERGDCEACDASEVTPDGWSAWVQMEDDKTFEIDVAEEYDFDTRDQAVEKAATLTVKYNVDWEEF